jgi:hypothetical protein
MSDHLRGWCPRYGDGPPHFVDLLLRSNAPHPLCDACTRAWLRDDKANR